MIFLISLLAFVQLVIADQLDEAIASAIFRPTSTKCPGAGSSTSFSASYTSTMSTSKWHSLQATYEPDVFEIDMIHSDGNENRTWTLRIGKGGHISSLIVKAGEVVANEEYSSSFWNDLVPQMIAVNGALNTNTNPNFIHQAGPYAKDTGMPPPFYSPKLALDCRGNSCSTVNWGMQAHVPTPHDSAILYYTRYRDCGSGIIEYDMVMHHFGQSSSDIYDFFDVPWTGLRTSTYRDMMIADLTGKLVHHFPMLNFGGAETQLRNLDTTGGFTTFVQNLPTPVENYNLNVCVDPSKVSIVASDNIVANVPCDSSDPNQYPFTFVVSSGGPNAQATTHYIDYKLSYTVKMDLCNLQAPIKLNAPNLGNAFEGVLMVNTRTGFAFVTEYIIHFCWAKTSSYLHSNVTADVLNAQFQAGDVIAVKYIQPTTKVEDQLAITFVHGRNPEYPNSFYRGKSRLWYGLTNKIRDGTVWDVNFLGRLRQTETYYNRKYAVIDRLANMESAGMNLRDETFEDVDILSELPAGQSIRLWMNSSSFGPTVEYSSCQHPTGVLACTGSSTPKSGMKPWFYITCGTAMMTTSNPYHFAVFLSGYKKPYLCNGEPDSTRANWKLLGYFNDCASVSSRVYDSSFCPDPTESPSTIPSLSPSRSPSLYPSWQPSTFPSLEPSKSITPSVDPTIPPFIVTSRPTEKHSSLKRCQKSVARVFSNEIVHPKGSLLEMTTQLSNEKKIGEIIEDNCRFCPVGRSTCQAGKCVCLPGYDGPLCLDIDECSLGLHTCTFEGSYCVDLDGTYECGCRTLDGWENGTTFDMHGVTSCHAIDPCKETKSPCIHPSSICRNTGPGTFNCTCSDSAPECIENETLDITRSRSSLMFCLRQCDGPFERCVFQSDKSAYECGCKEGFQSSSSGCSDIDECLESIHKCKNSDMCVNLPGSYVCLDTLQPAPQNMPSYAPNLVTIFPTNSTPIQQPSRAPLVSQSPFEMLDTMEPVIPKKTISPLQIPSGTPIFSNLTNEGCKFCPKNRSSCIAGRCICNHGYEGRDCTDIDECARGLHTCTFDGAYCVDHDGTYQCGCRSKEGWVNGTTFDKHGVTSCILSDPCKSSKEICPDPHSTCVNLGRGRFNCACIDGYIFDDEIKACFKPPKDPQEMCGKRCSTTQYCALLEDKVTYGCLCREGYQTSRKANGQPNAACFDIDECSQGIHSCTKDQKCINTDGSFVCDDLPVQTTESPTASPTSRPTSRCLADGIECDSDSSCCSGICM